MIWPDPNPGSRKSTFSLFGTLNIIQNNKEKNKIKIFSFPISVLISSLNISFLKEEVVKMTISDCVYQCCHHMKAFLKFPNRAKKIEEHFF